MSRSRSGTSLWVVLVLVLSLAAVTPAASRLPRASSSSRALAERNLLTALQRGWGRSWLARQPGGSRWLPRLVNSRTGLLRTNTRAFCRRPRGFGRGHFFCVIRPAAYRRYEGLFVGYRSLPHRHFVLRPLYYKRGRRA